MTSYYIEVYDDRDVDENLEVKKTAPHWVKARTIGASGDIEYMRFNSESQARNATTTMMLHDSNAHLPREGHVTPFRIVEVEDGIGKVVWVDSRPKARKILSEMRAPLPPQWRKQVENL